MNTLPSPERKSSERISFPSSRELVDDVMSRVYLNAVAIADDDYRGSDVEKVPIADDPDKYSDDQIIAQLEQHFRGKTQSNAEFTWWNRLARSIDKRRVGGSGDRVTANEMTEMIVRRVHEFEPGSDRENNGYYQLIECGGAEESELTDEELAAIESTLGYIDQFSGGALALDPNLRRIVTTSIEANDDHKNDGGFANNAGFVLHINVLRQIAEEQKVDSSVAIAQVLWHEMLGHGTDRLVAGENKAVFDDYFRYSTDKVVGHEDWSFGAHESVAPIDPGAVTSGPARPYGYLNSKEDFATAVESLAARIHETKDDISHSEKFSVRPDAYRDELMLEIFDQAARSAQGSNQNNADFLGVGAPIMRQETPDGPRYVNARHLNRHQINAGQFMEQEAETFVQESSYGINGSKVRFDTLGMYN